ncbi:C1QL [Mytilus coruscus]|uniref:C1QL n=1 Tax=Mytilus coruscus TaxID=42192 RepID=A0A6J8DLN0_MYTCO|nr:C1QL [Mytilus coruscus]
MKISALFVLLFVKLTISNPDHSKVKRLSNDGKSNPLTWFILQQFSALGNKLEKLREVIDENRKNADTKVSVLQDKLEKLGSNLETPKPQDNDNKLIKQIEDFKKNGLKKIETIAAKNGKELDSFRKEIDAIKNGMVKKANFRQLENRVRTIQQNVQQMQSQMANSRRSSIVFFAFLKNDLYAVGSEVLKFADVRINKGGAFNPSTGVFTAPKQGNYQMSCTIMGFAGHEFFYLVMKNGSVYSYGTTSSGGHFNTETSLILMNLRKGDRVYIQHRHIASRVHANKNSYFSGYLISV